MSVTKGHLEFYRERGYVVLEGVLRDDDLAPVIQDHNAIVGWKRAATLLGIDALLGDDI